MISQNVKVPGTDEKAEKNVKSFILSQIKRNDIGMLFPLIALIAVIGAINPVFFSGENIINNLRTTAYVYVIGIAMTFVLISGGIDLSIAPVVGLSGILASMAVVSGVPVPIAILFGIAFGASIGLINAVIIVKLNLPSFIVTLGTMYMVKGAILIITQGAPVFPLPDYFNIIGNGDLFGVPYIIIVVLALAVIAHIALRRTRYGRSVYAVGGNPETARLSGINTDFVRMSVYFLTGIAAAISGIFMAARLGSAQPISGTGYEMLAIASVIIGGTSMFGGSGSVVGTAIGALMMTIISNGLILMSVSAYWQNLVVGAVIILAVGVDQYRRKKAGT
jgi:ribose/xylose/arabinose/galactoside ABC-type transport system permease subunit